MNDLKLTCPYCGEPAQLLTGKQIYPHRRDLHDKPIYCCSACDAYVGCHPGTNCPLGRLANPGLRRLKMEAHAAFDPFWKRGRMTRKDAYGWLATKLGISARECHIGMFDEEQCRRVVRECKASQ